MSNHSGQVKQGIRWRTEWSESSALWLRWPYRTDVWPDQAKAVQQDMRTCIDILATLNIPVVLQVHPDSAVPAGLPANVHIQNLVFGDIWIRDCAPFLDVTQARAIHYAFDGWGGIDDQFQLDSEARDWLSSHLGLAITESAWVLEGGALHHDGEGTGIACSGSILSRAANRSLTTDGLHQHLRAAFGIEKLLLVPGKLTADETGGHIDNFACFLAPGVIAVAATDDPAHPDYATCRRVVHFLQSQKDAQGRSLHVVTLPLPRAPRLSAIEAMSIKKRPGVRKRIAGMPLMASYTNFARICTAQQDVILMPAYGLADDDRALDLMSRALAELGSKTRVVSVPARGLLVGGGSWHCASLAI